MAAVVHTDAPAIFGTYNFNEAEDDVTFVKVEPVGGFTSNTPVTFEIPGHSASYIDLRQSYIQVGCHVEETDRMGNPLPGQHRKNVHTEMIPIDPEDGKRERRSLQEHMLKNFVTESVRSREKRKVIPGEDGGTVGDEPDPTPQEGDPQFTNMEGMTYERMEDIKRRALEAYIRARNAREEAEAARRTPDYAELNGKALLEMLRAKNLMELSYEAQHNFMSESDVPKAIIPVDNVLHSMWNDVEIYMNNTKVNDSNRKYMYRAYIETILNNSRSTKRFQLQATGFFGDTGNKDVYFAYTMNSGMEKRFNKFKNNQYVEMSGFLHDDVMNVSASIVNAVRTVIRLIPNLDNQRLQTFGENVFGRLVIDNISLMACKRKMTESVLLAHNEIMQGKPASYPYSKVEMGVFHAKKGNHSIHITNPYQSKIPTRLIVGMVSAEAYSGAFDRNPFRFQHYDVRRAGFYVDNQSICKPPYDIDPGNGRYIEPYRELYSILGKAGEDKDIGLTPEDYVNGYFLLPFDSAPTSSGNLDYIGHKKYGNSSIEMEFSKPLPEDIYVITYGVFPYLLEIDAARNVLVHPFTHSSALT